MKCNLNNPYWGTSPLKIGPLIVMDDYVLIAEDDFDNVRPYLNASRFQRIRDDSNDENGYMEREFLQRMSK